jgi:hypothetical protein
VGICGAWMYSSPYCINFGDLTWRNRLSYCCSTIGHQEWQQHQCRQQPYQSGCPHTAIQRIDNQLLAVIEARRYRQHLVIAGIALHAL